MLQNYNYRARNPENQVVTGLVQAASIEEAKKIMVRSRLTPLSISLPKGFLDYLPFFGKVSQKDVTMFARQLATMITAGLTLSQAIRLQIKQTQKGGFHSVLEAVLNDVQDGFSFSSALAKFPNVFNAIFINVVKSGEATGKLEDVLVQLATSMEKDMKVRGKIKGALFYPSFILVAMVGVAILMLTQVIPQLKDVFESSGKSLPPQTQFLLSLSGLVLHKGYLLAAGAIVIGLAGRWFLKTEMGIQFISFASLKLPIIANIIEETSMARFGRLLGMLLSSGVPLIEALRMINESFTNRLYQRGVANVISQVERGTPMSTPISNDKIFPLMVGQMVAVGEQTGKMDEVMVRMADYYESEVDTKVAGISSLIEPIVIVIMGVGVAWLVIAILLPVYQISSNP